MTPGPRALALAMTAVLTLSACGNGDDTPELMNLRAQGNGPDEFGILPYKPLELPQNLAELPPPAPGGANRTDATPQADAIAALGGNPNAVTRSGGVPASDGGLYGYAARYGVSPDIRQTLAAEDLEYRRDNNGRILERLFNVNVYYRAYERQSLDQHRELERWRAVGARTVSAPPRLDGE
jgi:hypothetical protein